LAFYILLFLCSFDTIYDIILTKTYSLDHTYNVIKKIRLIALEKKVFFS